MQRRDFLKAVGESMSKPTLTLKGATKAVSAVAAFDEGKPVGGTVEAMERSEGSVARFRDALLSDARGYLPRGTRFYVVDGGEHRIWKDGKAVSADVLAWFYSPVALQGPIKSKVIAEVTA